MNDTVKERKIPVRYDKRGNPCWDSRMSAPDNSIAVCNMVPDRIIPVIFVPGVMGSNLKGIGAVKGKTWTLNSPSSMAPWMVRGAETRKLSLTPSTMTVDDAGAIPEGTLQTAEELRRRGWGEVGAMSYGAFLVWLENALNDYDNVHDGERVKLIDEQLHAMVGEELLTKENVGLSYRYRFPVHACGYNWLDDNAESAKLLGKRIGAVIQRYETERKKCEKVILVTHSMGGFVARHCSEVMGYRNKIFGIVHGVMPALGAPAVYRRFKAGTEGDALTAMVLGEDAAEMTAVLSSAPGPLQLLPTPEYGNGWLKIKDGGKEYQFPQNGDPYSEIYTVRGKWWSMCEDQLINPLNVTTDQKKKKVQMDADWTAFSDIIHKNVKKLHTAIKGRFHPVTHAFFGSHPENKAYGTVTWHGDGGGWMRGKRPANVLDAQPIAVNRDTDKYTGLQETRDVLAPLGGAGFVQNERQLYTISNPDADGDGTVPHRSGHSLISVCRTFMQVNVAHEPAFNLTKGKENLRACRYTLRSIIQIAQAVQATSLKYD